VGVVEDGEVEPEYATACVCVQHQNASAPCAPCTANAEKRAYARTHQESSAWHCAVSALRRHWAILRPCG
jgi:hypothetical protein